MWQTPTLDPRTKLLIVLCLSSLAVLIKNVYILLLVLVLTLAAVKLTGGEIWHVFSKLKRFISIFLAVIILQSVFTNEGQAIVQVMQVKLITDVGLLRGLQTILRFFIVIAAAVLMTTANPRDIIQGLIQWKVPYELAFMVTIAIRFLPLLQEEATDTLTALQLRGVNLKQIPILKRLRTYSYLLMPLLTSVLMKSRDLSVAMEMRAFRAYPQRTSLRELQFSGIDYLAMALSMLIFLLLLVAALGFN
ncbi:MAG TPA: energy-coupling factor transporter transmembrane component T [Oscillospiraceae bacterium]|nr:energy-coupling factor transporter transmembrane component T [Oscillospiraceae bacterium]